MPIDTHRVKNVQVERPREAESGAGSSKGTCCVWVTRVPRVSAVPECRLSVGRASLAVPVEANDRALACRCHSLMSVHTRQEGSSAIFSSIWVTICSLRSALDCGEGASGFSKGTCSFFSPPQTGNENENPGNENPSLKMMMVPPCCFGGVLIIFQTLANASPA